MSEEDDENIAYKNAHTALRALLQVSYDLNDDASMLMDATRFKNYSKTDTFRWNDIFKLRSFEEDRATDLHTNFTFSRCEMFKISMRRPFGDDQLNVIDIFTFFSSDVYSTHPWHNHSKIIRYIYGELDTMYDDLTTFCKRTLAVDHGTGTSRCVRDGISDAEIKDGILKAATTMYKSEKRIRGIIHPMRNKYYSKAWAVDVAIQHTTVTKEHWGKAIDIMIENNCIPSTSKVLLSNLIRLKLKNKFFIEDEWKGVGNNRKHGLKLAMVQCSTTRFRFIENRIELYYQSKQICLNDYFGLRKDVCLYFSPRQFPTPDDLIYGDCCDSYYSLRSYIIEQSKKDREVTTTGGSPGKSVRFSCKVKGCKFYFWLKWNSWGYYINHYRIEGYDRGIGSPVGSYVGCNIHNH